MKTTATGGDDAEHDEGDAERDENDEVGNGEEPLHQPHPAGQVRIKVRLQGDWLLLGRGVRRRWRCGSGFGRRRCLVGPSSSGGSGHDEGDRGGGEEHADSEHDQRKREHEAGLHADVHVGRDARRAVCVHDHHRPAAALGLPRQLLCAGPVGRFGPEVLVGGWGDVIGAAVAAIDGFEAIGEFGHLDMGYPGQVGVDVGFSADPDEDIVGVRGARHPKPDIGIEGIDEPIG